LDFWFEKKPSGNIALKKGCQIFLDSIYHNGRIINDHKNKENNQKVPKPDGHRTYHNSMAFQIEIFGIQIQIPAGNPTLKWSQDSSSNTCNCETG
jgi:hypothetical protein